MNRRGFLSVLAAGLTLDRERLLWVPGAKLISIPKIAPHADGYFTKGEPMYLTAYWKGTGVFSSHEQTPAKKAEELARLKREYELRVPSYIYGSAYA